jgi:hypothetical protein
MDLLSASPQVGVEILSKIEKFPPEAIQAVYQHHEQNQRVVSRDRVGECITNRTGMGGQI